MTDDELDNFAPVTRLRRAAIALVDAPSAPALAALAEGFRGRVTFAKPGVDGVPDPERHLLSATRDARPVALGADLVMRYRTDGAAPEVTMTGTQVVLVADLLRELAARLRPGAAFGLSTGGLALAERTEQLADTLTELTQVRRPRPPEFDVAERAEWLTHAMSVQRPDLRNAVIHILDSAATERSPILDAHAGDAALAALTHAARDRPESAVVSADDPGFFLRSVAGRTIFDEAAAMRELLAEEADSPVEPPLVSIDAETAITAGLLLEELVARLLPGISFGLLAVRSELGIVAADLAAELLAQTRYGRPTFYPGPTRMWITASDRSAADGTEPGVLAPVDHLTPAAELLIPTFDTTNGESIADYERLRGAALDLCRLLDDKSTADIAFARTARQLHAAVRGAVEAPPAESARTPDDAVHQQWRSVELSAAEVVIAADLLDELAARVRPGAAFGPDSDLAELGDEYAEMATRLRDLSGVRRPGAPTAAPTIAQTWFARLREAAIHWLDVVGDGRDGWRIPANETWRDATINLYLLAQHRPARTPTPPVHDPARHLRRDSAEPIELAAEAADIAGLLRGSNADAASIVVSSDLGPYVGDALGELATRLAPGTAFGPTGGGEPLALIAAQLGQRILAHALVSYGRKWDWDSEQPRLVGPLTEYEARALDLAGTPYSVVLGAAHRPDTIIDVHWRADELHVTKIDDQGRPRLWSEFQRRSPTGLFLATVTMYRYDGDGIDTLDRVGADQFTFRPDGSASRMTRLAGRSEWTESVAEDASVDRLWQPVPPFGDWEPLREVNPLIDARPRVHYSLAWDSARSTPRAVIPVDQAERRDADGTQYCVLLGPQDNPHVLITVCHNDNKFAVHFFDDAGRISTIHTFLRVGDRFLHQAQQRLIYAGPPPQEYTLIATFEVRLDGLARATVGEPRGRGLVSERVESVDLTRYWRPLPEFGVWEWTTELDPTPDHWPEYDLIP